MNLSTTGFSVGTITIKWWWVLIAIAVVSVAIILITKK